MANLAQVFPLQSCRSPITGNLILNVTTSPEDLPASTSSFACLRMSRGSGDMVVCHYG